MKNIEPILLVASTNRYPSLTATVSAYYHSLLCAYGLPNEVLSLTTLPADFTSTALYANKGKNQGFNLLAEKMNSYQKYIFIVPQYNGSFPGVFKAFLDGYAWPQVFKGKKAALAGVSKGHQGNILGLSHLSDILQYLGMTIYPMQPKLTRMESITEEALQQRTDYLTHIRQQIKGFIYF